MKTDPASFDELRQAQRDNGYVTSHDLSNISAKLGIPVTQLHGLASCYPHFRLTPPPKADVKVCADMSCRLRGGRELRDSLDGLFGRHDADDVILGEVSCLGRCDSAPAVAVNDRIFSGLSTVEVQGLVDRAINGASPVPASLRPAPVELVCDPYTGGERYGALKELVATRDFNTVIESLKASGLRGMGGAGFPTGFKWELVRKAEGDTKYVVCNADESEPGTIKDRFIMTHAAHLLIEAMAIAGIVTGAERGYIYIRHEYEDQEHILEEEIKNCVAQGVLGAGIFGSDLTFHLEVFVSPGGYICGEESALLEAMEGKRGEPRNKPPFPVTHGLWSKPTVLNNVETFAYVPAILVKGVEWLKNQGRDGSEGLKFVGISGHINKPGVFELPMGTTYRDIIYQHAGGIIDGKQLKAFAPSGPSSGYLPASLIDLPLDWKALQDVNSMVGSGAVVVCDEDTCMLDMALNAVTFFRNESCGKCVPCRLGSMKMVAMLTNWSQGRHSPDDGELLEELSETMRQTSICGLGQIAPAPIESVLKHFTQEVEDHVLKRECPSGICFDGKETRL